MLRCNRFSTHAMAVDLGKHAKTTMKYEHVEKNVFVQCCDRAFMGRYLYKSVCPMA